MRVCHLNTCPVGVATQDPELRKTLHRRSRARRSISCASWPRRCARSWPSSASARSNEMVGRADLLEAKKAVDHWKARGPGFLQDPLSARSARTTWAATARSRRTTAWTRRWTTPCCSSCASRRWSGGRRSSPTLPIKQRQPRGRHHRRQRNHAALRRARAARGHDPDSFHGLGRAELRRVHAQAG